MPDSPNLIDPRNRHRSGLFVLVFQLDGLCTGLGLSAQTQQEVSGSTIALFEKVEKEVRSIADGRWIEGWPPAVGTMTLGDMIVRANVLRSAMHAFFTPEELNEYQASAAFNLKKLSDERIR